MHIATYLPYIDREIIGVWTESIIKAKTKSISKLSVATTNSEALSSLMYHLGVISDNYLDNVVYFIAIVPNDFKIPDSIVSLADKFDLDLKEKRFVKSKNYLKRIERNPTIPVSESDIIRDSYYGFGHRDLWTYISPYMDNYRNMPDLPSQWVLPFD